MEKSSSTSIDPDQTYINSTHMTSSMLSRTSSSSSSVMGDYIGNESCFDVLYDDNDIVFSEPDRTIPPSDDIRMRREAKAEETVARVFPPPLPYLARTGNLPSHMPWVLKREYTGDGRLILREEKVRHHEYFRAHRSNGRLMLQLVPLDDDGYDIGTLDRYGEGDDDDDKDRPEGEVSDHQNDDDNKIDIIVRDDDDDDDKDRPEGEVSDHQDDDDDNKINTIVRDDDNDGVHDYHLVDDDDDGKEEEAGSGKNNLDEDDGILKSGGEDRRRDVLPPVTDLTAVESIVIGGGGGGGGSPRGKCLKSCFRRLQVPAIRPVLS